MAEKKVRIMVLKVDLQCPCCYKKVQKLLCKIPQIQNQIFDEKQNTVTITVVCCSPEKIRDKLYCKGGKTIKGIQILEPPKPPPKVDPPPPKVPKVDPLPPPPPKGDTPPPPPKVDPPPPAKVDPPPPPKVDTPPPPKVDPPPPAKVDPPPPKVNPPKVDPPAPPPPKKVDPPPLLPPAPPPAPIWVCCGPCYEGRAGGPCYHGCGRPVPCYDGYYGSGGGRVCYVSRCDDYFSDENATGCIIM